MSIETNKALVRRFLDGMWNYEKLQSFDGILAPDYVFHGPMEDTVGARAFRAQISSELESMANVLVRVDDEIAEGDRVAVQYTTWFEHHGEFFGAMPTGRTVKVKGISMHRVADGRIVESWETHDRSSVLRELGAEENLSESDRTAIRKVIDDAVRLGLSDMDAHVMLYYAEGAEVVAANGTAMRGRHAIQAWFRRFPEIAHWELTDIEIDGAGEAAFVRGNYTMLLSGRAKLPFDKGKYLEVWRKQADGSWKVFRHIFSSEVASRSRSRALAPSVAVGAAAAT